MAPADALSINGFACNAAYFQPRIKTAVARALTCAVANVFAGAIDAQTPGVAYACSDTLVVTGLGTVRCARLNCPHECCTGRDVVVGCRLPAGCPWGCCQNMGVVLHAAVLPCWSLCVSCCVQPLTCPLDVACKCTPQAYYVSPAPGSAAARHVVLSNQLLYATRPNYCKSKAAPVLWCCSSTTPASRPASSSTTSTAACPHGESVIRCLTTAMPSVEPTPAVACMRPAVERC